MDRCCRCCCCCDLLRRAFSLDSLLSIQPIQVYGVLLFSEGRQAEAREVLRQGVSHNPSNPQVGAAYGCCLWGAACCFFR